MERSSTVKMLSLGLLVLACLFSFRYKNNFAPTEQLTQLVSTATEQITQRGDNPTFIEKFTLNGVGSLDVKTSGGSVSVEGRSGNEVEVQTFVRKGGRLLSASNELMEELESDYNYQVDKDGNRVTAHARREGNYSWGKNSLSIGFVVYVPMEMTCELRTSGGGIKAQKLIGEQYMNTSGGGITLEQIKGAVKANTSGGGIKVSNQVGDVDLNTSGGRILVENIQGDVIGRTSGGSIKLEDIEGNADVHTSGGGISIHGEVASVDAGTSGGSINVDITGLSKRLNLSTSGGSITANIPGGMGMDLYLRGNHVNVDLNNFSGTSKKGKVEGKMNGGGMPVKMTTSGGHVNLNFKGGSAQ